MNNKRKFKCDTILITFFIAVLLIVACKSALADTVGSLASPSSSTSPVTEINNYVTMIMGALTGVATLLGLPIVWLNQRKTKAEITKLELEAAALRREGATQDTQPQQAGDGIRVVVDRSPYTTVKILADPRYLAPLLLLLDFVFAWVILTLANYFLNIFSFGILQDIALVVIALFLLLPIAKQATHIRSILRPQRTPAQLATAIRQTKYVIYAVYTLVLASCTAFSILLLVNYQGITEIGRYFFWVSALFVLTLMLLFPTLRRRVNRYIIQEFEHHTDD